MTASLTPTMLPMTPKQQRLVRFVAAWWAEHGRAPSLSDVSRHMGHHSSGTTHEMVVLLIERGWLKWPHLNGKRCNYGLQVA